MGMARSLRFMGYVYHTVMRRKLLSRESRQPSRPGARLSATGIRSHRREIKSFLGGDVESTYRMRSRGHSVWPMPLSTRRHDRRSSWNACETRRLCPWRIENLYVLFEPKVGKFVRIGVTGHGIVPHYPIDYFDEVDLSSLSSKGLGNNSVARDGGRGEGPDLPSTFFNSLSYDLSCAARSIDLLSSVKSNRPSK
jgi:hypothetical protein